MKRFAGILWILMASVCFGGMGALTKLSVSMPGVTPLEAVFWRSVLVSIIAGGLMVRGKVPWKPGNLRGILSRSIVGLIAMFAFFWSLGQIKLGTASVLLHTSPLFIVMLSGKLIGEVSQKSTKLLAALSFVGMLMIVRPDTLDVEWGTLAALFAGFLAALAYMTVRKLRSTDPPARIVFYFSAISMVVCAPLVLPGLHMYSVKEALALLGVGLTATGGQLFMTQAYRVERADIVGPFSYATVVLSYLFGLVFWGESVDLVSALGVLLIVLSGALLTRAARASDASSQGQEEASSREPA